MICSEELTTFLLPALWPSLLLRGPSGRSANSERTGRLSRQSWPRCQATSAGLSTTLPTKERVGFSVSHHKVRDSKHHAKRRRRRCRQRPEDRTRRRSENSNDPEVALRASEQGPACRPSNRNRSEERRVGKECRAGWLGSC